MFRGDQNPTYSCIIMLDTKRPRDHELETDSKRHCLDSSNTKVLDSSNTKVLDSSNTKVLDSSNAGFDVYDKVFGLIQKHQHEELEIYLRQANKQVYRFMLPLSKACQGYCNECIDLLIKYGADPYFALTNLQQDYGHKFGRDRLVYHIHKNTKENLISFLVSISTQNGKKHPLYTRDVLPSIIDFL
jgi:hypothetical protein